MASASTPTTSGWPGGAALVVALGLLGRSRKRLPGCFLAGAALLVAAYGLYWYHGECFGPRFYFVLLPVMIMLTLSGLAVLAGLLKVPASMVVLVAVPFTFLVHIPVYGATFYHNQRGISEDLRAEVQHPPQKLAIVLVQDKHPRFYFSSTVTLNDLALKNAVLYGRDRNRNTDIRRLVKAFPDRHIYRYRDGLWILLRPSRTAADN